MTSNVDLSDLPSRNVPDPVSYAVIAPQDHGVVPVPLCLLLMGGGGSRQSLVDCKPLFDAWWSEGTLTPMVLATPSAGMSYYVEDPDDGVRWDSFLLQDFLPHLRRTYDVRQESAFTAIAGISMGGYGALKTAFCHPRAFAAVAAMNPMLEPGYEDKQIGSRNRLHHNAGGPERLIGPGRDARLFAVNNPANRARSNASQIRESGLAIYFEAGDNDFVNAHDGTEFLHRVLWDLDISHDYRLVRGGDHGGPTFRPRMRAMFGWLSTVLTAPTGAETSAEERALIAMRAQLQPLRERAAMEDPSANRRLGILPTTTLP